KLERIELSGENARFAESLRGRKPLTIAAGGTRLVIVKTLQAVGVSDLVGCAVTADDVAVGSPAPHLILQGPELRRVAPPLCLVREDAPAGVIAAQAAGMTVVPVPAPLEGARK